MHNIELSHCQSTFRYVSVLATSVIREFTLQAKTRSTVSDSVNNIVHLTSSKCLCDKGCDLDFMARI
jgi:hypothetical protein